VFDSGFVQDIKKDINNNLFGLFKNDHRFRQTIEVISETPTINMIINGYEFYDDMYGEGFNFNYFALSGYPVFTETIRSGLSTNTGSLSSSDSDVTLFFGYFKPYNELIEPTESNLVVTYNIVEGAYIARPNSSPYSDPVRSDSSAFDTSTESFYFTDLVDCGLETSSPVQRAVIMDGLSGNLTQFIRGSALNVVDGGYLCNVVDWDVKFTPNDYYYVDSTTNPSEYTLSSIPYVDNFELNGKIVVRNAYSRQIYTLSETLPYLGSIYDADIMSEINNNVVRFEISGDVIFIETPSYLVINKLVFNGTEFEDPKTAPIHITHPTGNFDKISNRYKIDNMVYYCKLATTTNVLSSNDYIIYPEIYRFDTLNFKNLKIFPANTTNVTDTTFFNISGGNIRYIMSDPPTLTHNSRNSLFNISFLLKDQNNYPQLHELNFSLNPEVSFTTHQIYNYSPNQISNILTDTSTLNVFLSSSSPTHNLEELII